MGIAESQLIASVVWIIFIVAVIIAIDKAGRRNSAKERDPEMEQIRQEMAELRGRMDEQYADLTRQLDNLRGKRQHQANREA